MPLIKGWKFKGEVAERFKAHAWKACFRESGSRVRIPSSPLRINEISN